MITYLGRWKSSFSNRPCHLCTQTVGLFNPYHTYKIVGERKPYQNEVDVTYVYLCCNCLPPDDNMSNWLNDVADSYDVYEHALTELEYLKEALTNGKTNRS